MIDLKSFDPEKDLKEFLKPHGEKALFDCRAKFTQDLQRISERQKNLLKDSDNFKLQLITIAGGTISIFVALQGNSDISFLTKVGFASLGISLVFGIASLFFGLESKQFSAHLEEDGILFQQKQSLDFLDKFYPVDLNTDKEMLSIFEKSRSEFSNEFKKRQSKINKILKFIHLSGQRIENGQIVLFMLGVVFIVFGLFI